MRWSYVAPARRKEEKACRTSVRRQENSVAEYIIVVS
jgi:hypothetical protein